MSRYKIIFDNNCAVCSIGVNTMMNTGLMGKDTGIPLSDHTQFDVACNVDPQKACNEMAVVDMETRKVEYGIDGYVSLLKERQPFFGKLLNTLLGRFIANPLYTFFASNRRIIAPLKIEDNTCTPALNKKARFAFVFTMGLYAALITFLKGEILATTAEFHFLNGFKLLQVTGIGWILTGLFYREDNRWDYWGHLAVIATSAIFLQTLALIGYYFLPSIFWVLGSMFLSDLLMTYLHYKRTKGMGKSQKYTLRWWLILHLTAIGSVAQYYYFE